MRGVNASTRLLHGRMTLVAITGALQAAFGVSAYTFGIVAPPGIQRRYTAQTLIKWARETLQVEGELERAINYRITEVVPRSLTYDAFFFGHHWYQPGMAEPVPLIERSGE